MVFCLGIDLGILNRGMVPEATLCGYLQRLCGKEMAETAGSGALASVLLLSPTKPPRRQVKTMHQEVLSNGVLYLPSKSLFSACV